MDAVQKSYDIPKFKEQYENFIGGEWVASCIGMTFESRNPADGTLLATLARGDARDVERAVAAARRAFEGPWARVKPYERQRLLRKPPYVLITTPESLHI